MQTKQKKVWLGILGACAALVVLALVAPWLDAHAAIVSVGLVPTAPLMASIFVPVRAKNVADLARNTQPTGTMVVRAPFYDTQAYVSAATTNLTFFTNINNDKTLSNTRGNGGTFPQNTYFEPLFISCDFLGVGVAGVNTIGGKLDDIDKLFLSGRGTLRLTVGQTQLPEIPLSYCHASGGPVGTTAGTFTAPVNTQFGTNGAQDSGYCIADSFTITPNSPFSAILFWTTPQTLTSTTPMIRLSIDGNWYLPISG
jgi:hypothetical protein